ncbi:caspase family protein [Yersinia enterocolitica]|uniref:caspase family protein n=1 Tax=Yersinia enterocolitica TaxID=630 RepID=UPI0005E988D1|nr:caspase family protein [Yersinia enterocolitica]EKN4864641.1 caspase family protein [Yersinia enterocolitica]EKN5156218.1 caspase family protein [Yersinia enterocolitica]EKN6234768.1 caspase family protein [Yersinia enterocolitica]ELI8013609.1 caspase family protein [Yersinia enterocolitica]ELW7362451.1 caspase family protein [Yersinia enterocolitica]
MNLAIVIGVSEYNSDGFDNLPACKNDAETFKCVIENVKKIDDLLFLNGAINGSYVKNEIAKFVDKNKSNKINEVVFYFSGHGERNNDDFLYLFSDYESTKVERASLRNSELDDFMRTLSPDLCVKIVDACYSGTRYIKGNDNGSDYITKSLKDNSIKNSYFLFSSGENEASYAGNEFSRFTESFLTSLTEIYGDIRYRDIISYIADDMSNKGEAKPVFVSQANSTEIFGKVTDETKKIIYSAFGLSESQDNVEIDGKIEYLHIEEDENSIITLEKKSREMCFSESELISFYDEFMTYLKDDDRYVILDVAYKVSLDKDPKHMFYDQSTSKFIGDWLNKNKNFFATPTFSDETYEVEEYKEKPKKPNSIDFIGSIQSMSIFRSMGIATENDKEYVLEKVNKKRSVVNGFKYTCSTDVKTFYLKINPKLEILTPLIVQIIPIYSNSKFVIHYSFSFTPKLSWEMFSAPAFLKWSMIDVKIKLKDSAEKTADFIQKEIINYLEKEIRTILK